MRAERVDILDRGACRRACAWSRWAGRNRPPGRAGSGSGRRKCRRWSTNRASIPVSSSIAADHQVVELRPAGVRNASPEMRATTFDPGASRSAISSTSCTRSAPRWRLLKRMLSRVERRSRDHVGGVRGVEMAVNSRLDGGKARCPRRDARRRAPRQGVRAAVPDYRRGEGKRRDPACREPRSTC